MQSHSSLFICPDSPLQLMCSWEPTGHMWPFSSCSQLSYVLLPLFYFSMCCFFQGSLFLDFQSLTWYLPLSNRLHLSSLLPYKLLHCSFFSLNTSLHPYFIVLFVFCLFDFRQVFSAWHSIVILPEILSDEKAYKKSLLFSSFSFSLLLLLIYFFKCLFPSPPLLYSASSS